MAEALAQPSGALGWLRAARADGWRALWRRDGYPGAAAARQQLVVLLDQVAEVRERLAERVASPSPDGQPLANAAAICRWELLVLRQRVLEMNADSGSRGVQSTVARHLAEAAGSAQLLSSGYRFHHLDRICRGGQALDDHLEALARLRVKLAATAS